MAGLRGRRTDAVLVPVVAFIGVAGLVVQSGGLGTAAEFAALLAVLISSGLLFLRRRFPVVVGVVALAAVTAYGFLLQQPGPIMLVFVVALYTVVDEGHLAVAIGLGVASVLAFAAADSLTRTGVSGNGATFLHAGWLVAVIAGVTRNRRAYLAEVEARTAAAELRAAEQARHRSTEDRLRIARELHDVLGHHLSLINVQAGAALHRPDPVRSEQALATIRETSRETLRELRAALNALRQDGEAPLTPPPGLNRLGELTAPGLAIRVEVTETRPLPSEVDLAAYRIVQEAVTNVTRHAAAKEAVVRIRPDGPDVLVEIDDDGLGPRGDAGPGNGILGMRERARALGGTLATGPRPGGGFRVSARLPLSPDRVPS
ncbi:signal transduction histidine kinase [Actinoplanes campanulatus]|uniref:histidine kinase n=1 Tax=Actinoplanes campanulatus TaxID=113559 RepID=A0A7W5AGE9_9ACTN|nr:sensor histidine kinase [Actinoplanes campanulatus]MBB3095585.1 signal transduction histidine kinase [Actinoplanes campanulatus]GGN10041.1 two-component sensor histidine kinase [Actinoplanes campanulatus]GID36478.1 two-component sensor histidine kinase [Actinoplanes campanulatus]